MIPDLALRLYAIRSRFTGRSYWNNTRFFCVSYGRLQATASAALLWRCARCFASISLSAGKLAPLLTPRRNWVPRAVIPAAGRYPVYSREFVFFLEQVHVCLSALLVSLDNTPSALLRHRNKITKRVFCHFVSMVSWLWWPPDLFVGHVK